MANLRDIRKRIGSVESIKQITRTMEMVATAKINQSFKRIQQANPYSLEMRRALGDLAKHVDTGAHPLLAKRDEVKRVMFVVVASDRGLAGGFNSNVLREFDRLVLEKTAEGAKIEAIACGKKAIGFLNYRKVDIAQSFAGLSADPTVREAKEIASLLIEQYVAGDLDEAHVIYNHARNTADQVLLTEKILPIDDAIFTYGKDDEAESEAMPTSFSFEPDAEAVLDNLLPAYVGMTIYHALLDSAAGEQGARRKAMMAATDNATEMIGTLHRVYNSARQAAITTELTEIVSGAAALEE